MTKIYTGCFTIVETKHPASEIFPVDFILFLYPDYCWEKVNILIYLTKYSKIMSSSMDQKIFCVKTLKNKVFQDCSSKIQKEI